LPTLQPTHFTLAPPRRRDKRKLVIAAVASAGVCAGAALHALVQPGAGPRAVAVSSQPEASAVAAATPPPARGIDPSPPAEKLHAVEEQVRLAAPALVAEAAPPDPPAAYYDQAVLKQVLRWALRNSEECHKEGRAAGSAELFITFEPSGTVSEAKLVGEPIASAPVARCVLDYARAILLPPFDGPAFTVSRTLTLR
jgi:hypothetical protein